MFPFVVAFTALAGCGKGNGILEIDSGAPHKPSMGGVPTYSVHVGERAEIRFGIKLGTADYAILHDEAADSYEDCGPLIDGRFIWPHRFDPMADGGQTIRVTVDGFIQHGRRDAMPVGGRLVEGRPPNDALDQRVATATVVVELYQSAVEFDVKLAHGSPDWSISRLIIKRADGKSAKLGHVGRTGRGFSVKGPNETGAYQVRYEPTCDEVNREGVTEAELQVADENGRITPFATTFPTP